MLQRTGVCHDMGVGLALLEAGSFGCCVGVSRHDDGGVVLLGEVRRW